MSNINIILKFSDKAVSTTIPAEETFNKIYEKAVEVFGLGCVKFVLRLNEKIVDKNVSIMESEATDNCEITVETEETLNKLLLTYVQSYPGVFVDKDSAFVDIVSRATKRTSCDEELVRHLEILSKYESSYDTFFYLKTKEEPREDGENDEEEDGGNVVADDGHSPELEHVTGNIINDLLLFYMREGWSKMIDLITPFATIDKNLVDKFIRSRYANVDIVKKLVNMGIYVDEVDDEPMRRTTLLMTACGTGDVEIVKYLISVGADINFRNNLGRSALYYAIISGHIDVVRVLAKYDPIILRHKWPDANFRGYAARFGDNMVELVNQMVKKSRR